MPLCPRVHLLRRFGWLLAFAGGAALLHAQTPTPNPGGTPSANAAPAGPPPSFTLKLDPAEVAVGDEVQLELVPQGVSSDQISNITMEPDANLWHIEAQWRRDWKGQVQHKTGPWHARLRPFDLGAVPLPAIKIEYTDATGRTTETTLTSQTLQVRSVRANTTSNELIGLRDPLPLREDLRWLWMVMAAAAVGAALVYFILWWHERRKRIAELPPPPPPPPGLWALEELDRRSRLPVCRTGPAKVIFSLVSEVLRMYLGRRYNFNAIDLTTLECMQALAVLGPFAPPPEVRRWVQEFLEECDLVKFTTFEPAPERWQQIWNDARLIVTQTTPAAELETAPAAVRQLALGPGVAPQFPAAEPRS